MRLQISDAERKTGKWEPEKLALAVQLVRCNGAVIIERALEQERIDTIHTEFTKVLQKYESDYGYAGGDFNAHGKTKHIRMDLPFVAPFTDTDVIANPFFLAIAEQILGVDLTLRYMASNNSMPGGTQKQPAHSDTGPLFPEGYQAHTPTHSLVLHVPMVDFTSENGATEFWPSTHLVPDDVIRGDNRERLRELADVMHYEQAIMPKGSFLIRDKKLWHRGCPNRSDEPRGLFTLIYQRAWDATSARMPIPQHIYDQLPARSRYLLRMEDIADRHKPYDAVSGAFHQMERTRNEQLKTELGM